MQQRKQTQNVKSNNPPEKTIGQDALASRGSEFGRLIYTDMEMSIFRKDKNTFLLLKLVKINSACSSLNITEGKQNVAKARGWDANTRDTW